MSSFRCPHCGAEHDDFTYPDLLMGLGSDNIAHFECDCGAEFDMHVDFDPVFDVLGDSLKRPQKADAP